MKASITAFLGLLCAATAAAPAGAVTFRWANDGDVGAMDPDTRQETVQLSFLANIYEPLVRRDADLKLEPALATSWEQIEPHRLALPPPSERQMAGRLPLHRR